MQNCKDSVLSKRVSSSEDTRTCLSLGKGNICYQYLSTASAGLRPLCFDKGVSESSSGLSVGMLQIYLWIHQEKMLFFVVCQPASLEEGSGAGSTAVVKRGFILALSGSQCLSETMVLRIKCLEPKSCL